MKNSQKKREAAARHNSQYEKKKGEKKEVDQRPKNKLASKHRMLTLAALSGTFGL